MKPADRIKLAHACGLCPATVERVMGGGGSWRSYRRVVDGATRLDMPLPPTRRQRSVMDLGRGGYTDAD